MKVKAQEQGTVIIGVLSLLLVLFMGSLRAQNVGINGTGAAPDNAAMLDVSSTSKAFLPPRVSLTATNVFAPVAPSTSSVTAGFVVYNTATAGSSPTNVVPGLYYWNGSQWNLISSSGGNGLFNGFQVFTSSGTWTRPTGVTRVMVEMWGGGGGGGGSSSGGTGYAGDGGGGGAYNKSLFTVTSNITVTIGAAGTAGTSGGGNGGAGGSTSISGGATMTAGGGSGGLGKDANATNTSGGTPTATSSSVLGITGYQGGGQTGGATGGVGGAAPAGGAGGQPNAPGTSGGVPGGGGSGASQTSTAGAAAGGAGGSGMVIIWY